MAEPIKLPPGATLVGDAPMKLPPGATLVSAAADKPPQQGFFGSAWDASGIPSLPQAIRHPLDTISGMVKNTTDNVKQGMADYGKSGLSETTRRDFGRAVPIVGPVLAKAQEQHDSGNDAGMAGTLTGFVGGAVAGEGLAKGMKAAPGMARTAIAGDVTKPIGITGVSPLDRFNSANAIGAKLDAASATNSGPLKLVKKVNENSLLGAPVYEKAKAANVDAVHSITNDLLNEAYPGDAESGGVAIQNALKANQQSLKTGAEDGFYKLTQQTNGQSMHGSPAVGEKAQSLLDTITPLADKYPSLAPGKTMSILSDLTRVGKLPEAKPAMSGLVDEFGKPMLSSNQPAPGKLDTFSDLQRLRSATYDLTTTNPDLVKSQAIAPLQQMTHSLDSAMTDASNGLTPDQAQTFRDANSKWAEMKGTYDNTSNPLHHAVRTPATSKLFSGEGLGSKTPEVVRDLKGRLGDSVGALQRGVVESALKPTGDGVPNYMNFPLQLNRIPEAYRNELLSSDQTQGLKHITNTVSALGKDFNPSGSGKLIQNIGEANALGLSLLGHPAAAIEPLMQYPVAKMMNSPKIVNWLMDQKPTDLTTPKSLKAARSVPAIGSQKKKD